MRERLLPLPRPRGPISEAVIDALGREPRPVRQPGIQGIEALGDDDAQLALWCCYQLAYSSFAGVDDEWEWEPSLLALRRRLERQFMAALIDEIGPPRPLPISALAPALEALATADGLSLSGYLLERGTRDQMREFLVHRSAYQRKEADPHTWVIPRLRGRAKSAVVQIQYDEYGNGVAAAMHSELFATTMRVLNLDPAYGAYLDLLPGTTLATDNLVSLFGLHRRLRAECVGHLALFEMTSIGPMGRYSRVLERLGAARAAREFYDVHVSADAVHQQIALEVMVAGMMEQDPALAGNVLFGARGLMEIERRFARSLLDAWQAGSSSLLRPLSAERVAS